MPIIKLQTTIKGSKEMVFDLSRSIDLHKISTKQTSETAIAGRISGLIGLGESVTWRAKHFGVYQKLTVEITDFDSPNFFADEMIQGVFESFRHEHYFTMLDVDGSTLMTDYFVYKAPLGFLGRWADRLFLKKYMTDLLRKRNKVIKEFAESEHWKLVLKKKYERNYKEQKKDHL